MTSRTSTSVHLEWQPPHDKSFVFFVSYNSHWDDSKSELNTTQPKVKLDGLIPNSLYRATIKCIYFNEENYSMGFWSAPVEFKFNTSEDVPAKAPTLSPGRFEFVNESTVRIAWQPLPQVHRNGRLVSVRIRIKKGSFESGIYSISQNRSSADNISEFIDPVSTLTEHKISTDLNEAYVNMGSDEPLLVYIDQGTLVGFNDSLELSPIVLPPTKRVPRNIEIENATVDKGGVVTISWQNLIEAQSYTFYWCWADRHRRCVSPLETETVAGNSSRFVKQFCFDGERLLATARSAEHLLGDRIISSGMETIPCIFNLSIPPLKPPKNFHLHASHSDEVTLKWNPPSCFEEYPPYFSHYVISYCSLPACIDIKEKPISRYETTTTMMKIASGNEVRFYIQSVSDEGTSLNSPNVDVKVLPTYPWFEALWILFPVCLVILLVVILLPLLISIFKKYREPLKIHIPESQQVSF